MHRIIFTCDLCYREALDKSHSLQFHYLDPEKGSGQLVHKETILHLCDPCAVRLDRYLFRLRTRAGSRSKKSLYAKQVTGTTWFK